MLEAYAHVIMMDVYLSGQEGSQLHGIHVRLLGVKVFAITLSTSPAGSLPKHPTFGTLPSGTAPAKLC